MTAIPERAIVTKDEWRAAVQGVATLTHAGCVQAISQAIDEALGQEPAEYLRGLRAARLALQALDMTIPPFPDQA